MDFSRLIEHLQIAEANLEMLWCNKRTALYFVRQALAEAHDLDAKAKTLGVWRPGEVRQEEE